MEILLHYLSQNINSKNKCSGNKTVIQIYDNKISPINHFYIKYILKYFYLVEE